MKALIKFLRLDFSEKSLLIKSWLLIILVRFGLSIFSFEKLRGILKKYSNPRAKYLNQDIDVFRVGTLVAIAGRYWYWKKPCLTLALIAKFFLDRRGVETVMHIGVKKDSENKLEAHAWLKYQNQFVIGKLPNLNEFKEFSPLKDSNE